MTYFYLTEIFFLTQKIFLVFLSEKYKNGTTRKREKIYKKKNKYRLFDSSSIFFSIFTSDCRKEDGLIPKFIMGV